MIVVNAEKVVLTGKRSRPEEIHHPIPGTPGVKVTPYRVLLQKKPELVLQSRARMLPHNRLGRKMIKKLKVYPGP